ncbi:MAG: hypothetical protein AAFQ36_05245 [Pseudomonadota bacterium]
MLARAALLITTLCAAPLWADAPVVTDVRITIAGDTARFDVTVSHPDTGWSHYADVWEVLDAAGNRLGYRELFHPHVNEQPFTRSLSGVRLPDGTSEVFVRAHDSVHGWGEAVAVPLP